MGRRAGTDSASCAGSTFASTSATPYFLGRVGRTPTSPFPWVVSDFGLIEAIESGLVKVPQLAVRDTTGEEVPGYFNIWQWLIAEADTGGTGADDGSEAGGGAEVCPSSHSDVGRDVEKKLTEWGSNTEHTATSGIHSRLQKHGDCEGHVRMVAEDNPPTGLSSARIKRFRNNPNESIQFAWIPKSSPKPTETPRAMRAAGCDLR